jgi:hypothetical protein
MARIGLGLKGYGISAMPGRAQCLEAAAMHVRDLGDAHRPASLLLGQRGPDAVCDDVAA